MNPIYEYSGQVTFLTGAASGMGLAAAQAFSGAGAAVALVDANSDAVAEAAGALASTGGHVIACDISDEAPVKAAVERTVAEFGSLDMAFNNAGIQCDATSSPTWRWPITTVCSASTCAACSPA